MKWIALQRACLLLAGLFLFTTLGCEYWLNEKAKEEVRASSDFTIERYQDEAVIGVVCDPVCPSEDGIYKSLDNLLCTFEKVGYDDGYSLWHLFTIYFSNDDRAYYGMVDYANRFVVINMNKVCPPFETGLCPGIFEWEMGNILLERVYSKMGRYVVPEREKLQFRKDNGLLYGCREWDIKEVRSGE
jgi:hypothetical protein